MMGTRSLACAAAVLLLSACRATPLPPEHPLADPLPLDVTGMRWGMSFGAASAALPNELGFSSLPAARVDAVGMPPAMLQRADCQHSLPGAQQGLTTRLLGAAASCGLLFDVRDMLVQQECTVAQGATELARGLTRWYGPPTVPPRPDYKGPPTWVWADERGRVELIEQGQQSTVLAMTHQQARLRRQLQTRATITCRRALQRP